MLISCLKLVDILRLSYLYLSVHRQHAAVHLLTSAFGVCSKVVEWETHIQMYTGLSPTGVDHREGLI